MLSCVEIGCLRNPFISLHTLGELSSSENAGDLYFVLFDFFLCRCGDVVEAQAAVVEPEQAHHAHTMQRS